MSAIRCIFVEAVGDGMFRHGDKVLTQGDLPVGAMWYADWYKRKGPDGHCLIVKTPGGIWSVDGRASNCTLPHDNEHCCWVRHGSPPNINVDKNGNTCGCGCSIGLGENWKDYHGFLRNGSLFPHDRGPH
jgi:hypothetical protein